MTKGLKQSVCDQSFYIGPVSKFWAYAFVLSKAPELGEYPLSLSLVMRIESRNVCAGSTRRVSVLLKYVLVLEKLSKQNQPQTLHVLVSRD